MSRCFRTIILALIFFLQFGGFIHAHPSPLRGEIGIWAAAGMVPFDKATNKPREVYSPDQKAKLVETDRGLLLVGKRKALLSDVVSFPRLTEVLWAPNSRMFAVNGSDGGAVGTWKMEFYVLDDRGFLSRKNVLDLISPWVRRIPQCEGEDANYGAAAWMPNSDRLLVITEVPPHSICRDMGTLKGFVIDISEWKIGDRLSEQQLLGRWGHLLGSRFRK